MELTERRKIFLDTAKGIYPTSASIDEDVAPGATDTITITIPSNEVWTGDYLTIGDIPLEIFDLEVIADSYVVFPRTRIGQEHLDWRCPFPLAMHETIVLNITNNDSVTRTMRLVIWYSVIPQTEYQKMVKEQS